MTNTPLNPEALEAAFDAVEHPAVTRSDMEDIVSDAVSAYLAALPATQLVVTSVEELDALPAGSYVQGWDGFKHAKDWDGGWHLIVNRPSSAPHLSGSIELPARVLYRPEVPGA